jgi:hypothetical protein
MLLDIAQKNASLIWGNQSVTAQDPKEIFALTAASGNLTTCGKLNAKWKENHSTTYSFQDNGISNFGNANQ